MLFRSKGRTARRSILDIDGAHVLGTERAVVRIQRLSADQGAGTFARDTLFRTPRHDRGSVPDIHRGALPQHKAHADDARDAIAAVSFDSRMRHNIARRIDIDAQRRGVAPHSTARHGQTPDHIHIGHIICSI